MSQERPLRIAIIGAGPAGFYAAASLMKHPTRAVHIDLFDRLPVPYGLVRSGVAPDHANIKAVTRAYARTASKDGFRFFGNVELGRDLFVSDLDTHYDQWLVSVGCADDRKLDIPGEDLPGSHSAREFVAWYNGHPDFSRLDFGLDVHTVGIVGMGNVALDVTRVLMRETDELASTDIAAHAVKALRRSNVSSVTLFARRGPASVACTPKELGELGELDGVDVVVNPDHLDRDTHTLPDEPHPNVLANIELLREYAAREPTGAPRTVRFEFYASPTALLGDDAVTGIQVSRTELVLRGSRWSAQLTEESESFPVDRVFRSIGYRGHRIEGLPYDEARGGVPNEAGRILDAPGGSPLGKSYTAGWAKRGPSGVIGTNRSCAQDTVDYMFADTPAAGPLPDPDALAALLAERGVRIVSWDDWLRIDAYEIEAGKKSGKPREKVVEHDAFMALLADI